MRRRNLLLVLATGAAFALSAAVGTVGLSAGAAKGTTTYPTTVHFLGASGMDTDWIVFGQLDTNRKCRGLRKVRMYEQTNSGYTQVGKILSSARGAWVFRHDIPQSTEFKFTVDRDTRRDGNVVCEADSYTRTLGISPRVGTAASSGGVTTGTSAYPTKIQWLLRTTSPDAYVAGQLNTNETCFGLRKVRMYVLTSSGYRRVDTILSSPNGMWAFLFKSDPSGTTEVKFTVAEDTRRHGSVVCERRTKLETFNE